MTLLTPAQLIALRRIAAGEHSPHGSNHVRIVRELSERGLCTLEDCGRLRGVVGGDSERWFAEMTDQGFRALQKHTP